MWVRRGAQEVLPAMVGDGFNLPQPQKALGKAPQLSRENTRKNFKRSFQVNFVSSPLYLKHAFYNQYLD